MRRKRILWQIFVPYISLVLFSLLTVAWYASTSLKDHYFEQSARDLKSRAFLIHDQIKGKFHKKTLQDWCVKTGNESSTRITLVSPKGNVLCDTKESPGKMSNHSDRPEVIHAIQGETKASVRHSKTLGINMMYVAIPLFEDTKLIGILRTSIPITSIDKALDKIYFKIAIGWLAVSIIAAIIGLIVSRKMSEPLVAMKNGAKKFANGNFNHKLEVPNSVEIGGLAEALNQMAEQLDERLQTIVVERNELEAVLSSMVEGVLALDFDNKIIRINAAGAYLIGTPPEAIMGKKVDAAIANDELKKFVSKTLHSDVHMEEEIKLYRGDEEKVIQLHGTVLKDSDNYRIGALIVLNDMTKLHKLENIRRDFVASVSHELRTPITSIKGFVETLLDGAMNDTKDLKNFLSIISSQADRLNTIIDDLLSISRIERDADSAEIILSKGRIVEVLQTALQTCLIKTTEKNIDTKLDCPYDLEANINAPLLEQAVINLVDNAIKYSETGNPIYVEAKRTNREVIIEVRDEGSGIPKEHIPRLFERFYRVDKARSRKLGGTGLGLAITKHIINAHGGRVTVKSKVGVGSTFRIHLPFKIS